MNRNRFLMLGLALLVMLACSVNIPGSEPTPTVALPTSVPTTPPTEVPTQTPPPPPTATTPPTTVPLPPPATATSDDTEPAPVETYVSDDYSDPANQIWLLELITDPVLEGFEYRDGRLYLFNNYSTEDAFGITQATYLNIPQNFAATVEIEFGDSASLIGEAGFVFRVGADFHDYEFTITPEGLYAVYKYDGEFAPLVDYTFSNLIRTGAGQVNQLTVLADGERMTFLINGQIVEEVVDDDIIGSDFGLIVYNFDEDGMSAYFDNLLITSIAAYEQSPPPVP